MFCKVIKTVILSLKSQKVITKKNSLISQDTTCE